MLAALLERISTAAACTAALAALLAAPTAVHAERVGGSLVEKRCRLEAPRLPAALAWCGELVVPENPGAPDGERLALFVARVPALTGTPKPDPLVLLAGGPGQSAVDLYLQLRRAFEAVRREREILLLDQRGTGRSADGFRCELTDTAAFDSTAIDELADATRACLDELERDPRFFTTEQAVDDLEALRAAVGAEQWNLYGVSYGTRVAQRYAARYPTRVRTMVLDGVVPASLALGPAIAPDAQAALDGLFARCAADADCAARYPDLAHRFAVLRMRLESGPVSIEMRNSRTGQLESRLFTATDLAGVVRLMSYTSPTASLLPLAIDSAYDGDYTMLAAQAELLTSDLSTAMNMPMHNSVICTEDVPFYPADAARAGEGTYLGRSVVEALETICRVWPTNPAPADIKEPLRFDGPVLVLSGELDPVTPPRYANEAIAAGLRRATHVIVPGQGHGIAGVGCASRVIAAFIEGASPDALDTRCLAAEPPMPFFLSAIGPAP